eukprot:55372_1
MFVSLPFPRIIPFISGGIKKCSRSTIKRYCGRNTRNNKKKPETTPTDVTKSIKEKLAKRKHDLDISTYTHMTRTKIQNPSGYQEIKKQLRKCNNVTDVMNIMMANKKCEDVQVGTTAITKKK